MAKIYPFPAGPIVSDTGFPTVSARAYLSGIQDITQAIGEVEELDSITTYTADELRDKINEILAALKG